MEVLLSETRGISVYMTEASVCSVDPVAVFYKRVCYTLYVPSPFLHLNGEKLRFPFNEKYFYFI